MLHQRFHNVLGYTLLQTDTGWEKINRTIEPRQRKIRNNFLLMKILFCKKGHFYLTTKIDPFEKYILPFQTEYTQEFFQLNKN